MRVNFECTKRVHGRVHDVVQIAAMAGGTKVPMHTYTEAVTAHVVSQCKSCDRVDWRAAMAASLRPPILRDRSGASRVRFAAPL